jgi:hypothetical protein
LLFANLISQAVFHNFVPFFNSHALFQELPVAAFSAIDNFKVKNPDFELPSSFQKVVALNAKIHDYLNPVLKKDSNLPSGPRSDRVKKTKSPVRCLYCHIFQP